MSSFPSSMALCASLLPLLVTTLTLPPPPGSDGSLTLTTPSSSSLLPSLLNTSVTTVNSTFKQILLLNQNPASLDTDIKIDCDEHRFGNPPLTSCRDAIAQLPRDPAMIMRHPVSTYGPRGQGTWDVNLPKRYISMDGRCIIDFTQSSAPSTVSIVDILGSATVIEMECLGKDIPPWGGEATQIGLELTFQFTLQAYRPPFIRCSNAAPDLRPVSSACQTIIDNMNADTAQTSFGAEGVEDVQQYLPMVLTESTHECFIEIDIEAPDDKASWYDLWQAAVALDGMCARPEKRGKARFLGANRKIAMEIKRL